MFIKAKDDGRGGDNWSYVVQSSSQIITINKPTSIFLQLDALPVAQPTVSKYWREKYHIPCTCLPQHDLKKAIKKIKGDIFGPMAYTKKLVELMMLLGCDI